jgi:hypothetical protein
LSALRRAAARKWPISWRAMQTWKLEYMKSAETRVSGLAKTKRSTCHLKREAGGRDRTEEMNATWNETRM